MDKYSIKIIIGKCGGVEQRNSGSAPECWGTTEASSWGISSGMNCSTLSHPPAMFSCSGAEGEESR